jgi:hypothetical protein
VDFRAILPDPQRIGFSHNAAGPDAGKDGAFVIDVLPDMPSFMRRVCSGYTPRWGVLRTPLV